MRTLTVSLLLLSLLSCAARQAGSPAYEYHHVLSHEDWTVTVSVSPEEAPPEGSYAVRVSHAFFMVTPVTSFHERKGRLVDCRLGNIDEDEEPELLVTSRTRPEAPLELALFNLRGGTLYPVALADWRELAGGAVRDEVAELDKEGLKLCYTAGDGERRCLGWKIKDNRWSDGS